MPTDPTETLIQAMQKEITDLRAQVDNLTRRVDHLDDQARDRRDDNRHPGDRGS